jgi:cytochrome c
MMRVTAAGLAAFALYVAASALGAGQTSAGKELFAKRCGGCHALDRDMEGPRLGGVYGRAAASLDSFAYSDALRKSKIEWNDATLERWLAGPDRFVPGNDMEFHVDNAGERSAIIAYLKKNARRPPVLPARRPDLQYPAALRSPAR